MDRRSARHADRVRSVGNLKYDVRVPERNAADRSLLRAHTFQRAHAKVLVCGSTHEGEEAIAARLRARVSFPVSR